MITKEEIIEIIHRRDDRLEEWLKNQPEKLSTRKLKQELQKQHKEIDNTQKLAEENDLLFPENSLGTVYTFMNVATRASYIITLLYIKKLEDELAKLKRKSMEKIEKKQTKFEQKIRKKSLKFG